MVCFEQVSAGVILDVERVVMFNGRSMLVNRSVPQTDSLIAIM